MHNHAICTRENRIRGRKREREWLCFNNIVVDIFLREFLLLVASEKKRFAARKYLFVFYPIARDFCWCCIDVYFRLYYIQCLCMNALYECIECSVWRKEWNTVKPNINRVTGACFKSQSAKTFSSAYNRSFVLKVLTSTRPNRLLDLNERIKGREFTIA